jgi:hypothetical protein
MIAKGELAVKLKPVSTAGSLKAGTFTSPGHAALDAVILARGQSRIYQVQYRPRYEIVMQSVQNQCPWTGKTQADSVPAINQK